MPIVAGPALATSLFTYGVSERECVSVFAVGLLRIECTDAYTTHQIDTLRYWLHMVWIHASPVPAEMIDDKALGDVTNEQAIEYAVPPLF